MSPLVRTESAQVGRPGAAAGGWPGARARTTTRARRGLAPHRAAVALGDGARDGQAQAGALGAARRRSGRTGSKAWASWSGSSPGPSSRTTIRTIGWPLSPSSRSAERWTEPPSGRWWAMALPSRLVSTWRTPDGVRPHGQVGVDVDGHLAPPRSSAGARCQCTTSASASATPTSWRASSLASARPAPSRLSTIASSCSHARTIRGPSRSSAGHDARRVPCRRRRAAPRCSPGSPRDGRTQLVPDRAEELLVAQLRLGAGVDRLGERAPGLLEREARGDRGVEQPEVVDQLLGPGARPRR